MASKKKKKKGNPSVNPKILIGIAAAAAIIGIIAIIVSSVRSAGAGTKTSSSAGSESTVSEASAETESAAASKEKLAVSADDINITHYAKIDIKDFGSVTVALDETAAPETVKNFVSLAESGFYDGLTFHRIIDGFMMQGGDPEGNGTGGSDRNIKGEFSSNGFENNLSHTRGAISMARSQMKDSASSQFFIVHRDSTFLDGDYAAFGSVTEGMDVVDRICGEAKPADGNGTIPPEDQPVIETITITEAGDVPESTAG